MIETICIHTVWKCVCIVYQMWLYENVCIIYQMWLWKHVCIVYQMWLYENMFVLSTRCDWMKNVFVLSTRCDCMKKCLYCLPDVTVWKRVCIVYQMWLYENMFVLSTRCDCMKMCLYCLPDVTMKTCLYCLPDVTVWNVFVLSTRCDCMKMCLYCLPDVTVWNRVCIVFQIWEPFQLCTTILLSLVSTQYTNVYVYFLIQTTRPCSLPEARYEEWEA